MVKGAILFFAFSVFLFGCTTKIAHLPLPPPSSSAASPEITVSEAALTEREIGTEKNAEVSPDVDRTEKVAEEKESSDDFTADLQKQVASLTPLPAPPDLEVPETPPLLPDLSITDLLVNAKKRLAVTVANIGDCPLLMRMGNLKIFVDGQFKRSYGLSSLSDQPSLQPKENITFATPFAIRGLHEVQAYIETSPEIGELNQENNHLEKVLEGLPIGPDIILEELGLTEDLDLCIVVSNAGEADLRKGATFRIRVSLNGLRISEFDHFVSEGLKANFGNHHTIDPPHRVGIGGTAKVAVSVIPKFHSDDIYLGNNTLERTFNIFPFQMPPQGKEEFSFTISPHRLKDDGQTEKIKAEVRWEGEKSALLLSFTGPDPIHNIQPISEGGPQKVEIPIRFEEAQSESLWRVTLANLMEKKVEGHLIIQHP